MTSYKELKGSLDKKQDRWAVLETHKNATNLMGLLGDKKFAGQAFNDTASGIVSGFNQGKRILQRKGNKYNEDYMRLKRLERDFKEERDIDTPSIDFITERTKYFRDFKERFNIGTPQEAARSFLATYFAITDSYIKDGYTPQGAEKMAKTVMKSQIKNLNPISFSKEKGGRVISMRDDFLLWLSPKFGPTGKQDFIDMAVRAEIDYHYKWRQVQKEIVNYINKRGLKEFIPYLKHTQRKVIL